MKAELVDVVREWSKEVIRGGFHVNQDPEGMIAFSRDWFAQKAAEFAAGPPPPRDYAAEEAARRAAEAAAAAGAREQACCAPWPPCSHMSPIGTNRTIKSKFLGGLHPTRPPVLGMSAAYWAQRPGGQRSTFGGSGG